MALIRPPFLVPPQELNLWDEDFEQEYNLWRGKRDSSNSKEDYRNYIINLNSEFDMEEAFSNIEAGLAAIDTIIACKKRFTKYNLNDDLDQMYKTQADQIFKEFIKLGVQLVESEVKVNEKETDVTKDMVKNSSEITPGQNHQITESSELAVGYDGVEETLVVEEFATTELSQLRSGGSSPAITENTPIKPNPQRKKKVKKRKEKRQERLLKFQEKLVLSSGLPPSRLMNTMKRNLAGEFHELSETMDPGPELDQLRKVPAVPLPTVPMPVPILVPAAMTPTAAVVGELGHFQPQVQYNGITSSRFNSPMLSSMPSPGVGGCGWTPEWPDARPTMGYSSWSPGSSYGSTSGFTQSPTLSPIPTPGWNDATIMFQPNQHPAGTPAYCFHCLQYGSVFTVSPV